MKVQHTLDLQVQITNDLITNDWTMLLTAKDLEGYLSEKVQLVMCKDMVPSFEKQTTILGEWGAEFVGNIKRQHLTEIERYIKRQLSNLDK